MNVGTPDQPTVKSVKVYLKEFLLDPDVIDIPAPLRHLLVRGIILNTRPKKIAPLYQKIWMDEGSPLRVYSDRVAKSLNQLIGDTKVEFAMRYGNPSIHDGLERLKQEGVDELLLLPMFPHFAQATTESSLKEAYKQLKKLNWSPEILEIRHFETDDEYVLPLANSIQPHLDEETHLLFSYHGLPVSHVKRIDKSKSHCQKVDDCCSISCDANQLCYAHQESYAPQCSGSVRGPFGIQKFFVGNLPQPPKKRSPGGSRPPPFPTANWGRSGGDGEFIPR